MSTIVGAVGPVAGSTFHAMASKADRIVGTILGAALGDAVGLCTEFLGFTTRWQKSYWLMYNTYIIYK